MLKVHYNIPGVFKTKSVSKSNKKNKNFKKTIKKKY